MLSRTLRCSTSTVAHRERRGRARGLPPHITSSRTTMSSYLTVSGGSRAAKKTLTKTVRTTTAVGEPGRLRSCVRSTAGWATPVWRSEKRGSSLLGVSARSGRCRSLGAGRGRTRRGRRDTRAATSSSRASSAGRGEGVKRRGRGDVVRAAEVEGESNAPRRLPSRPPKRGKGGSSEITMASVLPSSCSRAWSGTDLQCERDRARSTSGVRPGEGLLGRPGSDRPPWQREARAEGLDKIGTARTTVVGTAFTPLCR